MLIQKYQPSLKKDSPRVGPRVTPRAPASAAPATGASGTTRPTEDSSNSNRPVSNSDARQLKSWAERLSNNVLLV